ncbi:MAG: hypothetical protein M0R05_03160 [Bacilli bacterium]|nr:hypothetical protein [Bacilli bacterium]MDD4077588.1 hypothetical protein [Bacilli bacterium]MDD4388063.1 hypothetical protein [Bacilli bacterium]
MAYTPLKSIEMLDTKGQLIKRLVLHLFVLFIGCPMYVFISIICFKYFLINYLWKFFLFGLAFVIILILTVIMVVVEMKEVIRRLKAKDYLKIN